MRITIVSTQIENPDIIDNKDTIDNTDNTDTKDNKYRNYK